jgi:hypothetical protein
MKRVAKSIIAASLFFCAFSAAAFAETFTTQSINGATGLVTTPTANVGWQDKNNVGVDLGYHYLNDFDGSGHALKATFSLFGRGEVGGLFDIQDRDKPFDKDDDDFLIHGKFRILDSLAAGANFSIIDYDNSVSEGKVFQFYLVYTYASTMFGMPAETSVAVGKTLSNKKNGIKTYSRDGDIDFSVGFDIDLFPQYLSHYVHWITDFANYSYTADPLGALPGYRACANTGFRIVPLKLRNNLKWSIDVLALDVLDNNREWSIGTTFGAGL